MFVQRCYGLHPNSMDRMLNSGKSCLRLGGRGVAGKGELGGPGCLCCGEGDAALPPERETAVEE